MKNILCKLLFCPPEYVGNVLMHIPVGLINIGIGIGIAKAGYPMLGAVIAGIFGYGFVKYEHIEQRDLKDKAYQDIKGWLFGLGLLGVPLLLTSPRFMCYG